MSLFRPLFSPLARKRWRRFKQRRRAYVSLVALSALFALGLAADLLSNARPLYVRFQGRSYFPIFRNYPDDTFTGSGKMTRPDYRAIRDSDTFRNDPGNWMLLALHPFSPDESIPPETLRRHERVRVRIGPRSRTGVVHVDAELRIVRTRAAEHFLDAEDMGARLTELWPLPAPFVEAIQARIAGDAAEAVQTEIARRGSGLRAVAGLARGAARPGGRADVMITLREAHDREETHTIVFDADRRPVGGAAYFRTLPSEVQNGVLEGVSAAFLAPVSPRLMSIDSVERQATFEHRPVSFPYRPVGPHWLGLDDAGRDVLARLLHGMRTSLIFGLLLVGVAMLFGVAIGAIQGYFAGAVDMLGQRLIEIWSALPFLYVMIFLGDVFGNAYRFTLLVVCFGLFNWIGVSHYVRAEFLRLRARQFVDAARCLGVPARKIIARHLLPNALTPVITLFPFSLVGAIGSLAALDFLGFGLPPEAPSWGQLLKQAQEHPHAWWLIAYPSLALFSVMLLGTFIGEGARDAYDPRPLSRME